MLSCTSTPLLPLRLFRPYSKMPKLPSPRSAMLEGSGTDWKVMVPPNTTPAVFWR